MKVYYAWRLAGLSSYRFLVSHPFAALRFVPLVILLWTLQSHAGGVVTNCTEANLRGALVGGGTVTFACEGTITLAAEVVITNDVSLDATGHVVALSGNQSTRIFSVTNNARLRLVNLTLQDGRAQYGGAINNGNGRVELLNCTLQGNVSVAGSNGGAQGGAIWNSGNATSILAVANCTFIGNRIEGNTVRSGGAISCGAYVALTGGAYRYDYGDGMVVNSTFVGNDVSGTGTGAGAAIAMTAGFLSVTNSTFADNRGASTVTAGGAGFGSYQNCVFARTIGGGNISGTFGDWGGNLSDDNSWPLNGPGSRYGIGTGLGGLAENGGATKTVALLEGSPAIDAGNDAVCPLTDQRGVARPVGSHCDIGAFEGAIPVPFFSQSFTPTGIVGGTGSRLQFTLQNTGALTYAEITLTNVLPPQIRIAAQPAVSNACGSGTFVATEGGGTIIVYGVTLDSNQTCNISVAVTSTSAGVWTNPAVAYWSDRTAQGRSNNPATLTVIAAPIATTLPVGNVASNAAQLHATVDPEGAPTAVYFQYGTTMDLGSATIPVAVGGGYAELATTADLAALAPDTTYFCRVVASNAVGVSYGGISSFATHGAPLTSSWFDQAALLAVLGTTNSIAFVRDGTITLTNTLLIDHDTTLDGTGHNVVLSGGDAVRVFQVNPGVRLTLVNLTIANGRHVGNKSTNFAGEGGPAFGGAIFNHGGTVTVVSCVLSNNSVQGGAGSSPAGRGGPARGGAVLNTGGTINITNTAFVSNVCSGGAGAGGTPIGDGRGGDGFGGAVCSQGGVVNLAKSVFSNNTVIGGQGGLFGLPGPRPNYGPSGSSFGGAINISNSVLVCAGSTFVTNGATGGSGGALAADGESQLTNCVMQGNSARRGGAILNLGVVSLYDSLISGNAVIGDESQGGGVFNVASMAISRCTLTRNTALGNDGYGNIIGGSPAGNGLGGGILNLGELRLTNSTLFANQAFGGSQNPAGFPIAAGFARGGGCFQGGGSVVLVHVTLSSNSAVGGTGLPTPGVVPASGGGIYATNGSVTLWNSIVANSGSGSNCFGTLIDGGHNLSSDSSCQFNATGSLNNTDPLLGPLGDYGGPTPTLPLLIGSLALNAANALHCPPTDQRGVARPFGAACDIGAFESAPSYPANALSLEPTGAGAARLVFVGTPHQTYQLLVSTNLPTWSLLTTITTDAIGMFQYIVTNDGSETCRFFKAAAP